MTTRHRTSPPSSPAAGRTGAGGTRWLHEIEFGYRMHARIERGGVLLLTCTGLNWTDKYAPIAEALARL
jgi:bifunctional non-homologous end joining protein LigD